MSKAFHTPNKIDSNQNEADHFEHFSHLGPEKEKKLSQKKARNKQKMSHEKFK